MTGRSPTYPSRRRALVDRRFLLHYLEMLAAMLVGMAVLGPVSRLFGDGVAVEVQALLMAAYMTTGMTVWMVHRRHRWPAIAEMAIAMFAPFVVLFPPLWAEWLTADALFVAGHVLMLPTMALAMLHRRAEYTGAHGTPPQLPPNSGARGSATDPAGPRAARRRPGVARAADDAESALTVVARIR